MARPLRLAYPDVALHVRQRGVNRENCFRADSDRLVYLSWLSELAAAMGCKLHAYCLMTNHVHLLLTPKDAPGLASLMRELGRHYVPYFNRRYGRSGTLWEGRFRSCLVDSARYVLGCYRYIESNPVRAGMVPDASAYLWSSYAGNVGARRDALLTPHVEYEALAQGTSARCLAYRGLFETPEDRDLLRALREATYGGYALVGESLRSRLVAVGYRIERKKPGPKAAPADAEPPDRAELFAGELGG